MDAAIRKAVVANPGRDLNVMGHYVRGSHYNADGSQKSPVEIDRMYTKTDGAIDRRLVPSGLTGAKMMAAKVASTGGVLQGKRFLGHEQPDGSIKVTEKSSQDTSIEYTFKRNWFGFGKTYKLVAVRDNLRWGVTHEYKGGLLKTMIASKNRSLRPLSVRGGVHFNTIALRAANLAQRLGIDVMFDFNGATFRQASNVKAMPNGPMVNMGDGAQEADF